MLCESAGQAQVEAFASEEELLRAFVDIIRALDPDIIIGYNVQKVTMRRLCYQKQCSALAGGISIHAELMSSRPSCRPSQSTVHY